MVLAQKYTIITEMPDEVFSLNLVLKYVRLSSAHVWGAEPNCSKPDHAEPNNGLPSPNRHV